MTDAQNDPKAMHPEAKPEHAAAPAPSRVAMTVRWTLAGLLTFVAGPYLWSRVVVTCMFLDFSIMDAPYGLDRPGLGGFALLTLAVAALMYRLDARGRLLRLRWRSVVVLLVIWVSIVAPSIVLITSTLLPLAERIQFVPVYVLSTLWMLWFWIMPTTALRRTARWGVFAFLLFCVSALPVLITFDGFGGDERVIAGWRFAVGESLPTTDVATQGAAFDAAQTDIAEVPSFPQFLGPSRTGVVTGMNLSHDLKTHPPRERWRCRIGQGWGVFATQANRAVTQERRGKKEMVICYDILTGRRLWTHADNVTFHNAFGDGPRATPTIADGRVYTVGAAGQLNCLELATGKRVWTVNILEDNQAENLFYGQCCSPLVVDDLVIVSPGGGNGKSLVAYAKDTGKAVWHSGNEIGAYASPSLMTIAGARQVVMPSERGISAYDPETGSVLWTHPWQTYQERVCTQPIQVAPGDNRVLVSFVRGCFLIELTKAGGESFVVKQLWESRGLRTKFSSAVIRGEYAYGLDNGTLVCIDLADGTQKWREGRYGHGQVLLADGLLIIQAEKGEVAFVEASPEAYSELYRMKALSSKTWNHPALTGRFLLVRNDHEAVCHELPQEL